jgi:hypothetical protein
MHISEKTTRKQLVEAATMNTELMQLLGGYQAIAEMETEVLREKITAWIMDGDEAGTITEELA